MSFGRKLRKAFKKAKGLVSNVMTSSVNVFENALQGDIKGVIGNTVGIATGGTVDISGQNKGILNANMSAAAVPATTSAAITTAAVKKKGLVSQLRKGKGAAGGGSYTETVKNPLGGSAGKTGK